MLTQPPAPSPFRQDAVGSTSLGRDRRYSSPRSHHQVLCKLCFPPSRSPYTNATPARSRSSSAISLACSLPIPSLSRRHAASSHLLIPIQPQVSICLSCGLHAVLPSCCLLPRTPSCPPTLAQSLAVAPLAPVRRAFIFCENAKQDSASGSGLVASASVTPGGLGDLGLPRVDVYSFLLFQLNFAVVGVACIFGASRVRTLDARLPALPLCRGHTPAKPTHHPPDTHAHARSPARPAQA